MTFEQLNIITPILQAVAYEGYETPSPIQEQAIPILLEGKDMLASAQTGTGKTAAFAIPILQGLFNQKDYTDKNRDREIKALVLAPTRELAEQIKDSFRSYSRHLGIVTDVVYGGVSQRAQEKALQKGVDVLIATPGRLLDLMGQRLINLSHVQYFILDEADRMLDMGFVHDVRRIVISLPEVRQTALFSATMPKEILKLAAELLNKPVRIEVTPPEAMIDKIKQSVFFVPKKDKINLLLDLLVDPKHTSVLIFTRTKHGANKLVLSLLSYGMKVNAIHGDKTQHQRQQALEDFKKKKLRVLVATDIAARGIDIDELSHVINYDLPESAETYVHRMGRTGRAGLSGEAYSFCSQDENLLLVEIENHIKMSIPVNDKHDFHVSIRLNAAPDVVAKKLVGNARNNGRKIYDANKPARTRDAYNRFEKPSKKSKDDIQNKPSRQPNRGRGNEEPQFNLRDTQQENQSTYPKRKKKQSASAQNFGQTKTKNNKQTYGKYTDEDNKKTSTRSEIIRDTYFSKNKKTGRNN